MQGILVCLLSITNMSYAQNSHQFNIKIRYFSDHMTHSMLDSFTLDKCDTCCLMLPETCDLLLELYALEEDIDFQERVDTVLGMTLESSDTLKFVLRLLYLMYGEFYDPMSMSQDTLISNLQSPAFHDWFTKFVAGESVPIDNGVQGATAKQFLNVRHYAEAFLDHDARVYCVILRMHFAFFST